MYFETIESLDSIVDFYKKIDIYDILLHFMCYGDEVLYVVKDRNLYGVITPGDVHRKFCIYHDDDIVNRNFIHVDNEEAAKCVLEQYPQINEIPVIKDNVFIGIFKSGCRKNEGEWYNIRKSFFEVLLKERRLKWKRQEIKKILKLNCKVMIYPSLSIDDLMLSLNDRKIIEEHIRNYPSWFGLSCLSRKEQKAFFGENVDVDTVYHLIEDAKNLKLECRNGIYKVLDYHGWTYNVHNGYRMVPNAPNKASKKIFMVGPCTFFGWFGNDYQTIQFFLQDFLIQNGWQDYEIVTLASHYMYGFTRLFSEKISQDDIVLLMVNKEEHELWKEKSAQFPNRIWIKKSLKGALNGKINFALHIYNSIMHFGVGINKLLADVIYTDLSKQLTKKKNRYDRVALQDYYVGWEIYEYYSKHFLRHLHSLDLHKSGKIGAIVMNCNPFTKGHRYLVEKASGMVQHLYLMIVEEDKSLFSWKDRYKMVLLATGDLKNVTVVPSGNYCISNKTFTQYFDKENVDSVDDLSYDLHVFGEVIAKQLGITHRFIGTEPMDNLTNEYNRAIKRILPEYGIEVVEVSREKDENGDVISATNVRKAYRDGDFNLVKKWVPPKVYTYIYQIFNNKYFEWRNNVFI